MMIQMAYQFNLMIESLVARRLPHPSCQIWLSVMGPSPITGNSLCVMGDGRGGLLEGILLRVNASMCIAMCLFERHAATKLLEVTVQVDAWLQQSNPCYNKCCARLSGDICASARVS